jgi:hypothetical protein
VERVREEEEIILTLGTIIIIMLMWRVSFGHICSIMIRVTFRTKERTHSDNHPHRHVFPSQIMAFASQCACSAFKTVSSVVLFFSKFIHDAKFRKKARYSFLSLISHSFS